ncbi:MAG: hypothetical protein AB1428_15365 [Bacteroidota bacterium]
MNFKKFATDFVLTFVIVLVVSIIATYLYGLIAHGQGYVEWETAIRLAIILGIVLPWLHPREHKQ